MNIPGFYAVQSINAAGKPYRSRLHVKHANGLLSPALTCSEVCDFELGTICDLFCTFSADPACSTKCIDPCIGQCERTRPFHPEIA